MKRNSNHRHATRVIAATHHHFKMVKGLSNVRGDLKHNVSMGILIITTILILFCSIVRTIVVFKLENMEIPVLQKVHGLDMFAGDI